MSLSPDFCNYAEYASHTRLLLQCIIGLLFPHLIGYFSHTQPDHEIGTIYAAFVLTTTPRTQETIDNMANLFPKTPQTVP